MFTAKNIERGEKVLCSVFKLLKGKKTQGRHSVVKNTGRWLNNLGLGFRLGKDILGFFKNIDLDNS